jgi:hypothetical protein
MKHRSISILFSMGLILSTLLAACAAAPAAVAPAAQGAAMGAQETFNGLRSVYQGQPGTFVMQLNQMYLAAWPKGSAYGFTLVCNGQCPEFNSLKLQTDSLAEMVKSLEAYGWKYVTPAALPQAVKTTLEMTRVEAALSALSKFGAPLMIVPVMPSSFEMPKPDVVQQ